MSVKKRLDLGLTSFFIYLAVVDARGRVFGVKKLRICDCSIFPIIPNANTATPAFMVSERMAVLIKEDLAQEPVEPLAFNLSYSVQCGKTLKVNKNQGLLAHSCGINAHAKVCTKPQHGTLILKKDGSFTYKSNNSFCAQDSFTYRIQTKQGHSSCATVSITSFRGSCKNSWTEHISQKVKNVAC